VVLFTPENKVESEWLNDNCQAEPWQYSGLSLAVDHRLAQDIYDAVVELGFYTPEE
jgi:hypothetical protein